MKKVRLVSIEGGGILSLSSIFLLIEIEKRISAKLNKKIFLADYFDLWAGNSAGSFIAALFIITKKNNGERHTAIEVKDIFLNFFKSKTTFNDIFADLELKDLQSPCMFPAYEPERNWLNFFTQHNAKLDSNANFYLKDAISASCALPVWVKPVEISSLSTGIISEECFLTIFNEDKNDIKEIIDLLKKFKIIDNNGNILEKLSQNELYSKLDLPEKYTRYKYQITRIIDRIINNKFKFIDGCMFANNPALCAVIEASKLKFPNRGTDFPKVNDVVLVSMGFSKNDDKKYHDVLDSQFKNQLIDILFKTQRDLTHFQAHYLFGAFNSTSAYFPLYPRNRYGADLSVSASVLDSTEKNIMKINQVTERFIQENDVYINELIEQLLQ